MSIEMKRNSGFTLVELLIVIGLLGAIALIVISAINPIEQSNRARDTKYKADSGQLISAIDRYFVTQSAFPWMTTGAVASTDATFGYVSATSEDVGLCAAAGSGGCTADGLLLIQNELKSEFRQRDFVKGTPVLTNQIMVGKASGSSTSTYACFVPLSKSIRDKACTDGKVYTLSAVNGTRTSISSPTCISTSLNWSSSPYYVCLPE